MSGDAAAFAAIAGMALVTYLTRAGGFWLLGRVTLSPRLSAGFQCIPGAVLISIVAPAIGDAGPRGIIAGVTASVLAWRTHSPLIAMIGGTVTIMLLRQL
jgi:uncharacterized membrane protein